MAEKGLDFGEGRGDDDDGGRYREEGGRPLSSNKESHELGSIIRRGGLENTPLGLGNPNPNGNPNPPFLRDVTCFS